MNVRAKFVTAGALAAGLLAAAGVATAAGSASAAEPFRGFELCAYGNYSVFARFPEQVGLGYFYAIRRVSPRHCETVLPAAIGQPVIVIGVFNTSSHTFDLKPVYHNFAQSGLRVYAEGTTGDHGHDAYEHLS